MESRPNKDLSAVIDRMRLVLPLIHPDRLTFRAGPDKPTVGEAIALMLLDLDWLASDPKLGRRPLPGFANEFLRKRLARRLMARYELRDLASEFERRFGAALSAALRDAGDERFAPGIERLTAMLAEIESAVAVPHRRPGS